MEQRFSLGLPGGTLLMRADDLRAAFEAELPDDGRGLYKAYLRSPQCRYLLGTLMPEQGRLRLCRTLTRSQLEQNGVWPVTGAEAELAFVFGQEQHRDCGPAIPGWTREEHPARLMGDRILSCAALEVRNALIHREKTGFALAVPFAKTAVFPLTPVFCFAKIETLAQQTYAVFHFSEKGCPIFCQSPGSGGVHRQENVVNCPPRQI